MTTLISKESASIRTRFATKSNVSARLRGPSLPDVERFVRSLGHVWR